MRDHDEPPSLDDRLLAALAPLVPVLRFAWSHVGTLILLAAAALSLVTLYHYRLRLAAEAGALRGAYEAARAREIHKARQFGEAVKPQPQNQEP